MALIDELKQKRAECHERYNRILADEAYYLGRLNDLDRAIAALEPAPTVLDELDEFVTTLEASPLPDEPAPAEPEAEPEPSLFDAEDEDGPPRNRSCSTSRSTSSMSRKPMTTPPQSSSPT